MADQFNILDSCGDELPVGTLVDRVSYHRFVALQIPQPESQAGAGPSKPAVFPSDHAVPDIVKEVAFEGFPPVDLEKLRGGLSLIREFEQPAEECGNVPPRLSVTVPDIDDFLADPVVTLNRRRLTLPLTKDHVAALETAGSALVRVGEQAVLVEVAQSWPSVLDDGRGGSLIVVEDVASVLTGDGLHIDGEPLSLEGWNVRELRQRGESLVRTADSERPIRILVRDGLERDGVLLRGGREPVFSDSEGVVSRMAASAPAPVPAPTATRSAASTRASSTSTAMQPSTQHERTVPTFPFVLYLPYRQDWTLVGYARGDLLNSIALAPQEEATIEISSWDRSRRTSDLTDETSWESSLEAGTTNRLSRDLVGEITRNEAWKLTSAGVQVGVPQKVDVGIDLGGDWGTEVTTVSRGTTAAIDEATSKAAFRARGMRQTKVSEAREWGFEERSTRKLRNPNTGRTVSYDAFEVIAAYDVTTYSVPDELRLAVQVPSPVVVRWDRQTVIVHEGVLARALLDPSHAAGFEAARWLAAREEYLAIQKEQAAIDARAAAAKAPASAPAAPTPPSPSPDATANAAARVLAAGDAVKQAVSAIGRATHRVASAYDSGVRGAELEAVILEYRQWLLRLFGLEKFQPGFWSACQRFEREFTGPGRTPERVEQLLNETGSAWLESVGRVALSLLLFGQWTLVLLAVELVAHLGWKTGWYAQYTARGFDDAGLGARLTSARSEVENWRKALSAASVTTPAPTSPVAETSPAVDPVAAAEPAAAPFSDPDTARRRVDERALLAHLEQHRSHYVEAIWRSIGPADRARLIDASTGNLGNHVAPEILGFLGDTVVVPFHVEHFPAVQQAVAKVTAKLETEEPPTSRRTVLPTPAVHLQIRVGNCDALEPFIIKHRALDVAAKRATVRRTEAEADAAEREAERQKARLEADPPMLEGDSDGAGLLVRLVRDEDSPTPDTTPG